MNPVPELVPYLKQLRLSGILDSLDARNRHAIDSKMAYTEFLALLIQDEVARREQKKFALRLRRASFRASKTLEQFDFERLPQLNRALVHELATGRYLTEHVPVLIVGPCGTGKSHLLIGLGTAAAERGYRVKFTLATKLVNELVEAADEKQLARTIARYGRVDLLCIDELGYMELDRLGAELLFQVLTEREEKASVAIASNESFSGWTKTFTDPRLCAAIVDRLTFNGTIIETGTTSYRLNHTRQRQ